ncbi:MAG: hypothetical protein RMJ07_00145 [Nitrososphaerota archaeon]|nr:hypothetical protein [Candidatus Bathyarchaeota archaeon]MDW8048083.1 hypothetical protein [Nitrososphaerota archaeon]
MKTEEDIWKKLEDVLGGGSAFRVILHLALNPNQAFTKYALVKLTGLRTPAVDNQLKTLVRLNMVKEYPYTPKTYKINLDDELARNIIEFLQKIKLIRG